MSICPDCRAPLEPIELRGREPYVIALICIRCRVVRPLESQDRDAA